MSTLLGRGDFCGRFVLSYGVGNYIFNRRVVLKVNFSSSANFQERFDWVLLGTSENFT